jgi:hypothetical protein
MIDVVVTVNFCPLPVPCVDDKMAWPTSTAVLEIPDIAHINPAFLHQDMTGTFKVVLGTAKKSDHKGNRIGDIRPQLEHLELSDPMNVARGSYHGQPSNS